MSLCELCLSLDLGAISRSDVMRRFGVSEAFPANHDLFYCTVKDTEFEDGGKHLLIPYHKSLESLQANAKYCDLCRLVQHSVDTVLENMRKANNHDYEYPLSGYELWIADIDSIDGFQVLGFHDKQDSRGFTQYQLMGGFGLCVEDGENIEHSLIR
ncbi:hypothetical protein QQZ08_002655 [Neonectria magnoliae]|uniref:Uncharacterized protein n=1 Tax=Neonectria magnoliae TaxID=2732573 RepID=A0ABR1IC05_9HYPO